MKKNKIILLHLSVAALLLTSTIKSEAQSVELGLRFMPTYSAFEVQSESGEPIKGEQTFGYGIGGFLGYNFNDHIGLQVEVIYNDLSQKIMDDGTEHIIDLKYINLPLLLSLNTNKSSKVNFNIVAGPQLGLNIGSDIQSTGGDGVVTTQAVLAVKKSDIGVAYGAGVDFGLNEDQTFRLGIGFRGVLGLFDISDQKNSITTDSYYVLDRSHLKTYSGYVGISYIF